MFFRKNKPDGPGFFCSAIVAAAGSSTRMGTNKLLMEIDSLGNEVKWGIPGGFTVFGSPDTLIKGMSVAGK